MSPFEPVWEPLFEDRPEAGRAGVLAEDSETFGFPVAALHPPGSAEDAATTPERFAERLGDWAAAHGVRLVALSIPERWPADLLFFQQAGFRFVHTALAARYVLGETRPPETPAVVLRAPGEGEAQWIAEVAETAFAHGRYHLDPLFPKELAHRRDRRWVEHAAANGQELLGAFHEDRICGFHVLARPEQNVGDVSLVALAPEFRGRGLGLGLLRAALERFRGEGVAEVLTRISAANTPVMNVHARLGARFVEPETVMHWRPVPERGRP